MGRGRPRVDRTALLKRRKGKPTDRHSVSGITHHEGTPGIALTRGWERRARNVDPLVRDDHVALGVADAWLEFMRRPVPEVIRYVPQE